ncbi:hypothetical protein [Novipirellula caenicola]
MSILEALYMFSSGVVVGGICNWLVFPHLVCLLSCRRTPGRQYSVKEYGLSYIATIALSIAVLPCIFSESSSELPRVLGGFAGLIFAWWGTVTLLLRRTQGVSRFFALAFPALFVPAVSVTSFACVFPVPGIVTQGSKIDIGIAAMILWPIFLFATILNAIYSHVHTHKCEGRTMA